MSFTRWVRSVSEEQLLTAAQKVVAERYGVAPPQPAGRDIFWQKVYAPIYHWLPWKLRAKVMMRMPGSHRQKWTPRTPSGGPAL